MKTKIGLLIAFSLLSAFAFGQAQEKVLYTFAGSPDGGSA